MKKITLLIHCKDACNIVASVTQFISVNQGNIVYLDQHVDREQNVFFMRLEIDFNDSDFIPYKFKKDFDKDISAKFEMSWSISTSDDVLKMAIFASKYDHCLYDLLGRYSSNELGVEIPFIISNHNDLKYIADNFNIPFYHIPVTKDTKYQAEQQQLELLNRYNIDFVVLARYMQIVSSKLIDKFPSNIINIHHSFLPAFVGAKPYHSAFKRGVKIIGATSHYITEELDAGPIIYQDVAQVTHTYSIKDLVLRGKDLEKIVLSNAVKLHAKRKVMVYNNKTVIFS